MSFFFCRARARFLHASRIFPRFAAKSTARVTNYPCLCTVANNALWHFPNLRTQYPIIKLFILYCSTILPGVTSPAYQVTIVDKVPTSSGKKIARLSYTALTNTKPRPAPSASTQSFGPRSLAKWGFSF